MPPSIDTKRCGEDLDDGLPRKRLAGSARTGQACDRCKTRKIRCDARPGGCSPCAQNDSECRTTDRITGRATTRGHTESIENENAALRMHLVELQQQLREAGVEPKPAPLLAPNYAASNPCWPTDDHNQQGSWASLGSTSAPPPSSPVVAPNAAGERNGGKSSLLPDFRPGCTGDNYLGVASNNPWLSPIEGNCLTLFGMKINLEEFLPVETDPDSSPMSYKTFLSFVYGKRQAPRPDLPSPQDCNIYADWWFRSVMQFIPVVHKPDFMSLLANMYNPGFEPSTAEIVMVHMMLATMNFQIASRNNDPDAFTRAMRNWHYSLTLVGDLIAGHKLQDIQALALICDLLRSQPRPGAAYMFTNMVLGLAIEMGLHRSASAFSNAENDRHVIEMRKRVFWSVMTLHVSLSGKLGRPMPLRHEDIDIEFPQTLADDLPHEAHLSDGPKCSFQAAPAGFELMGILGEVYATNYSIHGTNEPYAARVQRLEKKIRDFHARLPPQLAGGEQTPREYLVSSLYLQLMESEIALTLHHPSLNKMTSPQMTAQNFDICLNASRKTLGVAIELERRNALDITWYCTTIYLACMFTTLFICTQRQDQLTSEDCRSLRRDMDSWIEVVGNIGRLLGSGTRLRDAVNSIANYSLAHIERNVAARTASAGLATAGSPTASVQPRVAPRPAPYPPPSAHYTGLAPDGEKAPRPEQAYSTSQRYTGGSSSHYYPDLQTENLPQYSIGSIPPFNYSTEADVKPIIDAQLNPESAMPAHNYHPSYPAVGHTHDPSAWHQFTQGMISNIPPAGPPQSDPQNLQVLSLMQDPNASGSQDSGLVPGAPMAITQSVVPWPDVMYSSFGASKLAP